MTERNFELKTDEQGNPNPKYVDLLEEDRPISGQKFVCISFVSPENILKQKQNYYFEKFVRQWDFNKAVEKYNQFLNFVAYKYEVSFDSLTADLQEFLKDEKDNLINTTIEDDYKSYIDKNEENLENEFNSQFNFQTSTRGIKVRGVFSTQEEAELRCKLLREIDPNHDVYVGQVGLWMPFHPEAYKTGRVEYLEDELNQIMNEKVKNEKSAKEEFDARVRETKEQAIEENKEKAMKAGNKLTQTLDKDGNLINVKDMNSTERNLNTSEVSVADIRKELFEGDEVVMDKNNDHGLSRLPEETQKKFQDKSEDKSEDKPEEEDNVIDVDLNE